MADIELITPRNVPTIRGVESADAAWTARVAGLLW